MKKSILNLGKALDKAEQKKVNGGWNQLHCCGYWSDITHDCTWWCYPL